ncbi:Lrp/AsnC family transcriptional regulator [Candidatus Woesearchaeota archaeon]|nr:Lrp/AsnC family transcriptional regulator [Candidatus Woesearchaeota archaeon]
MDQKDVEIISQLRENARMPLTKMSRRTRIPVSTLFDRIRSNEQTIILRYTSLLDFNKLGYHARAHVHLRVSREDKELLKIFLLSHPSVNAVYRINNGYDFMVEGIFQQVKDLEEFIEHVEQQFSIIDKRSYFIIEDLKREGFLCPKMLTAE